MSSPADDSDFGANEWLVEEQYQLFIKDRSSVAQSWWPILERYAAQRSSGEAETSMSETPKAPAAEPPAPAAAPKQPAPPRKPVRAESRPPKPVDSGEAQATQDSTRADAMGPAETPAPAKAEGAIVAKTTRQAARPTPVPADAPTASEKQAAKGEERKADEPVVTTLRGMPKTLAANMDKSLSVPTATSVRTVPAKLMIDQRIVINNHLRRTRGGKVSFTHIIGYALVQALKAFPSQNVYYDEIDGKPAMVAPPHVNLGIAIDIPKPDGTRALLVPSIKGCESMDFSEFVAAYEALVKKARANKLDAADFAGTTISLTNPGGIGTVHSVPRLMQGQGCIIGVGALDYPAEFMGASPERLAEAGVGKTVTMTSTYDHRVIQGAGSGEFLKIVHGLLVGEQDFYRGIFADLRIPYEPIKWSTDVSVRESDELSKQTRVAQLINQFRVRGHLMADIDPLEYVQRTHPDLEIEHHGLSFWDLDREFVTGGFGGKRSALLRDILGVLRDSYCRTIGVEYMHIPDPAQRQWFQSHLEVPYVKPTHDEQMRILRKLNEAEAFETFLQTKYVGQKRFSLEGAESMIAFLDSVLAGSAAAGLDEVAIGMPHRGRLNVLTSIAGKTYGQVFQEFEGAAVFQGSGDVKYHLGNEGEFTAADGSTVPVYLAANPSHLEAVNGVLEGIVRAKQDRLGNGEQSVLPILVHGDAANAGQGVVFETHQLSQLRAYQTGGTVHLVVNNQVGFTTPPTESRSSTYATDIAKAIHAPVLHVNGDDPEAVVRVAELAFQYRQEFKRDIVVDLICYRRRGHNEGDDPTMTQPLMYSLIEAKRSVRTLYAENLVGRGDITEEEYQEAQADFQAKLEQAFMETHAAATGSMPIVTPAAFQQAAGEPESTGVDASVIAAIGDAHGNAPDGFAVHPKVKQVLDKRVKASREGGVDWAFGELLALGSLLLEGTPVRMSGQDTRRGTFVQRHAVMHDRNNGQEWLPLANLGPEQARLSIYDSLLSEYAAMAFEYGYSVERPDALVLWEAQFGDFANGAQIVIDEFIASAEQKWNQHSSLVLLLPHGYEGAGPDHSSGRIERFLQLAAEDNMTIARPSTPANHFHLLRRQAYARPRRPLIVFTPKAMLRLRDATSGLEDFTSGSFQTVIDDQQVQDPAAVTRVLLHSGKIHYDLKAEAAKRGRSDVALVRVEQLYPLPIDEINDAVDRYPNAQLVWVQEEPLNQGAWPFMHLALPRHLHGRTLKVVGRPASASPATGSAKRSSQELAAILESALG
ncbi:multifunctional oxoglutarate decarboxylase/oxoglutarate dehydrogenase thiamine pyrophosphate-binding subunit/dihydrolipoyllysine-residue succinyltransferase subunit [Agrococcus sp. TF02-05]|uniref:multifunctional oxoglutarate decarboxylase/oxoglutarate dehydrogenase thiamine pyrophosphate-binding subunit/dihydrolipoyllysine-residue succinyltransferase subunit n=1 Tax=Agrococcus sp. TF02-05 TaxID=2815211 RepID=UPI0027DAF48C|nr:multifunctional oxoglutarate decarboxylase/oxoglutarate dehydrogenase thiamine pyrophosphate-binding subunit/dihydrolipoyllysine-residue succinyltransferase subunit [Agrococcus sp. TF02-05]